MAWEGPMGRDLRTIWTYQDLGPSQTMTSYYDIGMGPSQSMTSYGRHRDLVLQAMISYYDIGWTQDHDLLL